MKYPHLTIAFLLFALSVAAQPQTPEEKMTMAVRQTMAASFLQNTEKYREAIVPAKTAQSLFDELNNGNGVIGSNSSIISNYIRLMEIDSAGLFVARNRMYLEKYDPIVIIAVSNHFALGQYFLTIANVDSALYHFQQLPLLLDHFHENGVDVDLTSPDYSKEMRLYLSMMEAGMNAQLNLIYGHSYNGLGLAYFANLEYGPAELAFRTALQYYRQQGSAEDQANALINLGQVHLMHRAQSESFYEAAKNCFEQALNLLNESTAKDPAFLSLVHRFMGAASLAVGDSTEALSHYLEGQGLLEKSDSSKLAKTAWISKGLFKQIYQAEMLQLTVASSENEEAVKLLRQLEKDVTEVSEGNVFVTPEFSISMYADLGKANTALKNWEQAFSWFEKAMYIYWPSNNPFGERDYQLKGIDFTVGTHGLDLLTAIASAHQNKYLQDGQISDNVLARRFYRAAGDVLEEKRFGFTAQSGNTYLKEEALFNAEYLARLVYLGAIAAIHSSDISQADKDEQVLDLMQRCKGFILNQALQDLVTSQNISPSKKTEEKKLRREINELKVKRIAALRLQKTEEVDVLAKELIIAGQQLERFYRELPEKAGTGISGRSLSIAEIQNYLVKDSNTVLLEYTMGYNDQLYATCVTVDTVLSLSINLPANWKTHLAEVDTFTTGESTYRQVPATQEYVTSAYQLYNLLIAPFSEYLSGADHLIINPDQQFHRLNFDCLLTAPVNLTTIMDGKFQKLPPYNQLPYLIHQYSTQYITSPITLHTQNTTSYTRADSQTDFFDYGGIEPIYERRGSVDIDSFLDHELYSSLKKIPIENVNMLQHIAPLFGNKAITWIGEQANEMRLTTDLQNIAFHILHFSAHGFLNDRSPLASKILLTHMASDDAWDDALEVAELYNMRLRANLGIISSCNSGASRFPPTGDGLISIGRGFFYAGCPSVIMSKWPLKVQSTAKIVSATCKGLQEGMLTAKALQQAKLTYLKETTNQAEQAPYFWAGLNLWGKNGRLFPGGE